MAYKGELKALGYIPLAYNLLCTIIGQHLNINRL